MASVAPSQSRPGATETPASSTEPDPGASATPSEEKRPGFWQRRLIQPIRNQLTQGVSPRSLSVGVAAGSLCGIFPVLGTTTVLTTLVAAGFRLNQPVMQAINWLAYPLQLLLIPLFIRGGEFLFGADPISFSIPEMMAMFADSPGAFLSQFKMTFVHCIVAWLVVVPVLGGLIALASYPPLRAAAERLPRSNSTPAS